MSSILEGFSQALTLILHLDAELLGIILLSIKVSGGALLIATLTGLPLGALLGLKKFPLEVSLSLYSTHLWAFPRV